MAAKALAPVIPLSQSVVRTLAAAVIGWVACLIPSRAVGQVVVKLDGIPSGRFDPLYVNLAPLGFSSGWVHIQPFIADDNGEPWLLRGQLYRISGVRAVFEPLGQCNPQRSSYRIIAFTRFSGRWYIGTTNGLFALDHGSVLPVGDAPTCSAPDFDTGIPAQGDGRGGKRKSGEIALLWVFGDHLWFKTSASGLSLVTRQHTVHHWDETNGTTRVATVFHDSLYVVTGSVGGEYLSRLSNTEASGSTQPPQPRFSSTRIGFFDGNNKPAGGGRTLLEVAAIGNRVWVIASDGVYTIINDHARWIAGPPAEVRALAERRRKNPDYFYEPTLLPHDAEIGSVGDYAFRYLINSGQKVPALEHMAVDKVVAACRKISDCLLGLTIEALAPRPFRARQCQSAVEYPERLRQVAEGDVRRRMGRA